jgi:HK97 family phage major capsid protein
MFVELTKEFLGRAPGERIHVSDADAQGLITAGTARAVTEDVLTPVIQRGIESALQGFTRSLDAVITETLQKFASAQSHSRRNAVSALFGEGNSGDPKKSFGDWCLAVARGDRNYLEKHYGSTFVAWQTKAALAESSGVTGGYTVPPEFYQQLLAIIAENSFIRPKAFVLPMGSATLQIPYLDITTVQSAGVSPFFGGVKMSWTAESQVRQETEPQFKQLELKAWELSGYTVSSNVLLQDSVIGLEKFLMNLFAMAIAWFEEYAFLQGNGSGKPQGILTCNAAIATGGNSGGTARNTANAVKYVDLATMWSKLLSKSWNSAFWVGSPSVVPQLLQLSDASNRALFVSIDMGAAKPPQWNLLGRPFICTEKVPALGTRGDLSLIDPGFYVVGDRMSIEVAASEHVNFLNNQMTWRVVERVDGQPWLDKPITLQDTNTQVSPFVVLN